MGIETYGFIPDERLRTLCEDATAYQPTSFTFLPHLLQYVKRDDVFVDIGCGKGRVLLFLGIRGVVRRVIGIDVVPELVEVAKRNLEKYQGRLKCPVTIMLGDCTKVDLSEGTVFYLYNPFGSHTLTKLLDNIMRSMARHRRPVRIIYLNPSLGYILDATDWLTPKLKTATFSIYESSRRPGPMHE